jgi:hypothetical protein
LNTNGDGRAAWLVRIPGKCSGSSAGLHLRDGCVTGSVGNLEQNELLHTGAGWLHSFDTETPGRGAEWKEGVSQQILTESRNPTPISFASNSFASQDMLTDPYSDPYSSFPVAFLGSFCLILRNLSILVHRF